VHVFRPRQNFLAEAQPRLEKRRGQMALFSREYPKINLEHGHHILEIGS
jgi:cyclopropane fatty-acyl-phospholipid synthase-like methyltransferase